MKITCIAVGKIKENYFTMAVEEYKKRLSLYGKLEIIELPDEKTPDRASEISEEQIRQKEGGRILRAWKEESYKIVLDIYGRQLDSVELSEKMAKLGVDGHSHITFVIGGSLGLSKEVLERADYRLSFSRMTFPHQLMRVILLEQLYRACRIQNGEPYHK